MTSSVHIPAPELCARTAPGENCGVERCGPCEALAVSMCDVLTGPDGCLPG